jgi:hypothetical protein
MARARDLAGRLVRSTRGPQREHLPHRFAQEPWPRSPAPRVRIMPIMATAVGAVAVSITSPIRPPSAGDPGVGVSEKANGRITPTVASFRARRADLATPDVRRHGHSRNVQAGDNATSDSPPTPRHDR